MSFSFEDHLWPTLVLMGLYFIISSFAARRLSWLHNISPHLNTRKLFVMSCFLCCVLRVMSFAALAAMNLCKIDFHMSDDDQQDNENDVTESDSEFFDKALLVLYNFPDFSIVSAYVLLCVIWAEAFLLSRRHWLSAMEFKKFWIVGYLIFNTLLYSVQLAVYSCLFMPAINKDIMIDMIYITLTTINLALPLLFLALYTYLSVQFAGFPPSSHAAVMRMKTLEKLTLLWTLARTAWGFLALTTVLEDFLVDAKKGAVTYAVELVIIFSLTEVVPLLVGLHPKNIQALVEKPEDAAEHSIVPENRQSSSLIIRSSGHGYSFSGPPPDIYYPESGKPLLRGTESERHTGSSSRKSQINSGGYRSESEDRPTMSTVEEYSPTQPQALGGWWAWMGFS